LPQKVLSEKFETHAIPRRLGTKNSLQYCSNFNVRQFSNRDDWCIRIEGVRQDSGDIGAVEGVVT